MIQEYREKAFKNFKVIGIWLLFLFIVLTIVMARTKGKTEDPLAFLGAFLGPVFLLLLVPAIVVIPICWLEGCYFYAKAKGYEGWKGLLLGLFLTWIGLIILFCLEDISAFTANTSYISNQNT